MPHYAIASALGKRLFIELQPKARNTHTKHTENHRVQSLPDGPLLHVRQTVCGYGVPTSAWKPPARCMCSNVKWSSPPPPSAEAQTEYSKAIDLIKARMEAFKEYVMCCASVV